MLVRGRSAALFGAFSCFAGDFATLICLRSGGLRDFQNLEMENGLHFDFFRCCADSGFITIIDSSRNGMVFEIEMDD
eukprot:scaffold4020_cov105-Pinguiococcus_pyrenoidosus.AAC.1